MCKVNRNETVKNLNRRVGPRRFLLQFVSNLTSISDRFYYFKREIKTKVIIDNSPVT